MSAFKQLTNLILTFSTNILPSGTLFSAFPGTLLFFWSKISMYIGKIYKFSQQMNYFYWQTRASCFIALEIYF